MSDIRVIVPDELKAQAKSILHGQDMTVSQAVRMFLREVVEHEGLPFQRGRIPNTATLSALKEAEAGVDQTRWDDADALFKSWDEA